MRRKIFTTKVRKTAALVLAASLVAACVGQRAKADPVTDQTNPEDITEQASGKAGEDYSSERISTNYTVISKKYSLSDYSGDAVSYKMEDAATGDSEQKLTNETKSYEGSSQVLNLSTGDTAQMEIDVPEDGLYCLDMDYLSYDDSILPISGLS